MKAASSPASGSALSALLDVRSALLPMATLLLVVFLVLPVPAFVLDIGFITNIMISLAVLMVALNASKPLDFSSFPTVLLFATLLRLGLNVASARVVLLSGHEGGDAAGHDGRLARTRAGLHQDGPVVDADRSAAGTVVAQGFACGGHHWASQTCAASPNISVAAGSLRLQ